MPYNGSGVFVRLFNWTNDASNNIPISATRFDGEDNDFAAGLSLCLTRDGQGVPSAPLTWGQPLTIDVGSDGTVIAAGRTGGVNNPQLQFQVADATGATINLSTAQQLGLGVAGTVYLALSGTGALSVKAPSGNAAVGIATGAYAFGNATDNPNYTFAGSGTITMPSGGIAGNPAISGTLTAGGFNATAATVPANGLYLPSANTLGFATAGIAAGSISAAGAWNIPAPSTAVIALSVNSPIDNDGIQVNGPSTSGQSYGISIQAGTTSADYPLLVELWNTNIGFKVQGDGQVYCNAPAVYSAGPAGTLQVGYLEAPPNNQTGNYTLAISDRSKMVQMTAAHTLTIPANAAVAFPVGTTLLVLNQSGAGNLTIVINSDTLDWIPSAATGSRTLAALSIATLYKFSATEWLIWGFGLS